MTVLLLGVAIPASVADQETDNLPGGTSISSEITSPADGDRLLIPIGDSSIDVPVDGTASIGEAEPVADTSLIFVLDVSGSTNATTNETDCGDQNGDGFADKTLDCEIEGIHAANAAADSQGTVAEVGLVPFAGTGTEDPDAAAADMTAAGGNQTFTAPGSDVDTVTNSAFSGFLGGVQEFTRKEVGSFTNFTAAVQKACDLADQATKSNKQVLFLSDGQATLGEDAANELPCSTPATFDTFAIGDEADCVMGSTSQGDEDNTLEAIAEATGGTCTEVEDPGELADTIPEALDSRLTGLTLDSDVLSGTEDLSDDLTSGTLTDPGPNSVDFAFTLTGVGTGIHRVTANATGEDGGGSGSVSDTHTFTVDLEFLDLATECSEGEEICKTVDYRDTDDGIIEVGERVDFRQTVTVENPDDGLAWSDVVVEDRFGAEIDVDEDSADASHGEVEFNTKGNADKYEFTWDGYGLDSGETATLDLEARTGLNPSGTQLYSECGVYEYNSGAVVKAQEPNPDHPRNKAHQVSFETDSVLVSVFTEDQAGDCDEDGLTDAAELDLGTDPFDADTDGDGVLDGEDNCPLTPNEEQTDSDGDRTGDACE